MLSSGHLLLVSLTEICIFSFESEIIVQELSHGNPERLLAVNGVLPHDEQLIFLQQKSLRLACTWHRRCASRLQLLL